MSEIIRYSKRTRLQDEEYQVRYFNQTHRGPGYIIPPITFGYLLWLTRQELIISDLATYYQQGGKLIK